MHRKKCLDLILTQVLGEMIDDLEKCRTIPRLSFCWEICLNGAFGEVSRDWTGMFCFKILF